MSFNIKRHIDTRVIFRCYGFQGQVTAGDSSDKKGKIAAGYNNLRRKKKKQQCKVQLG